ncbi:MAG: glycosyltransferase family 4 protein [Clostridiales bacterium]|nr:glycosyltransferase family 4 protein [Clostridiales bacterium]
MKKICFVMPYHILENRGGGAEVQAWLLAKELARRGFDVSYIAQSVEGKAGRVEKVDGVTIRWIRYAHYFEWANTQDYYRALKKIYPDVVVQRMTSFVTGVLGLYCRQQKRWFVWICTDDEQPRRWHFLKNQIILNRNDKINPIKALLFLFNAWVYDLSRQYGMKQVACAFTQNGFQKKLLKKEFGLNSFLMTSGHEIPTKITPAQPRLANRIVSWVANLGRKKRPEKFIELASRAQDLKLQFIMIGSKNDELYIQELFRGKPDNLNWLGRLSFDETLSWFDKATFFINTSLPHIEGFPNTFIHAWMHGVPVISFGVDPDGIIKKHNLGYVAQDVRDAIDYVKDLINNSSAYEEISRNVTRYAREKHSIAAMTDSFLNALRMNLRNEMAELKLL